jgi:hypothetical protein
MTYRTCPWWLWWRIFFWNENWQGKPKYSEKTCPSSTLSTTNLTCQILARTRAGGKPATNRLSYGAAILTSCCLCVFALFWKKKGRLLKSPCYLFFCVGLSPRKYHCFLYGPRIIKGKLTMNSFHNFLYYYRTSRWKGHYSNFVFAVPTFIFQPWSFSLFS